MLLIIVQKCKKKGNKHEFYYLIDLIPLINYKFKSKGVIPVID